MTGIDLSTEGARIYHLPVEATSEKQAAWARWVDDYAISCMQRWIESGDSEDDALVAVDVVLADWSQLPEEWMPVGHAMSNHIGFALFNRTDQLHGEERLRYMNMTRTLETASEYERTMAGAYHMGLTPQQFRTLAGKVNAARSDLKATGRTALYRYFDAAGGLLYVGIAADPAIRDEQHQRQSAWHKLAADRTVEWFESREEAHQAERWAIRGEEPLFNSTHASPETKKRAINYLLERVSA